MRKAYRDWYLSDESNRWYSRLLEYKAELQSMFEQPTIYTLADIHKRADEHFRGHMRRDLAAHLPGVPEGVPINERAIAGIDAGRELHAVLSDYLTGQINLCEQPGGKEFILDLNFTTNNAERIPIFVKYYCSIQESDSVDVRTMKNKYRQKFENGAPHDEVVSAMRNESRRLKEDEIGHLRHRLNELRLAQSAHLKAKAKKAEKDTLKYRHDQQVAKESKALCSYDGCDEDVDLTVPGGALQCVVCAWIANKVPEDQDHKQFYYCSPDHVLLDQDSHEKNEHYCLSSNWKDSCLLELGISRSETFDGVGLCKVCMASGHKALFCSEECYEKNYNQHAAEWHRDESAQRSLEVFKMPEDFEVEDIGDDPGIESGEVEDTEMKDGP